MTYACLHLTDDDVRWLSVQELMLKVKEGGLILLDCRDQREYDAGSILGARSLPQTGLMFQREQYAPMLEECRTSTEQLVSTALLRERCAPHLVVIPRACSLP